MIVLSLCLVLFGQVAGAANDVCPGNDCALQQLKASEGISAAAARRDNGAAARQVAGGAVGEGPDQTGAIVNAGSSVQRTAQVPSLTATMPVAAENAAPPVPTTEKEKGKDKDREEKPERGFRAPKWAIYGGAALIGGISGFLSGGPIGALVGAGTAVGSTFLWQKGDYGASIGMTAGAMLGGFFGGPILGSLVGALVGGIVGHFVGMLVGKFFK